MVSWNKYLSKPALLAKNPNLNSLVGPSFQGGNRLCVLAFENDTQRTSHSDYYFPNVELKTYNVIIDGKNFFVTYENIRKTTTVQGDDYTTGCLLDYPYFKEGYEIIVVDLSKQQTSDTNPKANQQINFAANLDRGDSTRIFFIPEKAKKKQQKKQQTRLDFSQGTVKVL